MQDGSVISVQDINDRELMELVDEGCRIEDGSIDFSRALESKVVGLYFRSPSTRTRTSFFIAVQRMGGSSILYGPGDLQLENGESVEDTGMVFGLYLDALVARTNGPESELRHLAQCSNGMIVVNALSKNEHPTQAIADLITVQQEFGSLEGRHILYVGAANNTSGSLMLAASKTPGLRMTMATPEVFAQDPQIVAMARENAQRTGARIELVHDLEQLPVTVDVVYTTRWQSMGKEPDHPQWRSFMEEYQVTEELLQRVAGDDCIFMHDLPASRGDEVTTAVMDAPYSRIRRQAHNKTISAMVVLKRFIGGQPRQ